MSLGFPHPPGPGPVPPVPAVGYPYAQPFASGPFPCPYPFPYAYHAYAYPCAVPAVPVYPWPAGYVAGYPYAWSTPPPVPASPTDTRPFVPVVSALLLRLSDEMHAQSAPAPPPPPRDSFASLAWPRRPRPFPSLGFLRDSNTNYALRRPWCLERRADDSIELDQFSSFVHKLLSQAVVTPNTLFLALFYAVKMLHLLMPPSEQVHEGQCKPEDESEVKQARDQGAENKCSREEFALHFLTPRSMTPYRLLLVGLALSNKLLDDHPFHTKTWEEVGMKMQLAQLERVALCVMHYDLVPPKQEWEQYLSHLERAARRPEGLGALSRVPRHLLRQLSAVVTSLRCPSATFVPPEADEEDLPSLMSSSSSLTSSGSSSLSGSPALTSSDPGSPLYIYH